MGIELHPEMEVGKKIAQDGGASIDLCRDATRMAKDVDRTLRAILSQEAGMTEDAALKFMKALKSDRRYQRDIY